MTEISSAIIDAVGGDPTARAGLGQITLPASTFADATTSFTPASLTGLVGWWDASDLSTITLNGATVAAWANKVAGGPAALQPTAASQPAYSATARNNRPGLVFDGLASVMPFDASAMPTGASGLTIFVVGAALTNSTSSGAALSYGAAANDQSVAIGWTNTSSLFVSAGTFGRYATTGTTWDNLGQIAELSILAGAGQSIARVNSNYGAALSTSGTAALSQSNGRVGANVQGASFWKGAIQSILIFNRALTTDERQRVAGYLAHKWGLRDKLRNGHPYKNAAPGGFATSGAMTAYEAFRLTETRPEFNVNDFAGASQNARIQNAIATLKAMGKPVRLRIGLDTGSSPATSTWIITQALVLPSNFTLLIDGVKIKKADSVFDNVIRNDGIVPNSADPNNTATALNPNQNIRVIGINGASLEGCDNPYTAAKPGATDTTPVPWVGDDYGWRTCNITFANVQNLEIGGFTSSKASAWNTTLSHGVDGFWVHDMTYLSTVVNGDGIDCRNGTRNGRIERITGVCNDDIVCLCAAVPFADGTVYPMIPGGYASNILGDDTYNISVDSISGSGGNGNTFRAFTSGALGTSLHHIKATNIHQTGSAAQCVNIGTFSNYTPTIGAINNLTVQNVIADTATEAVAVTAVLEDASFDTLWAVNAAGKAFGINTTNQNGSIRLSVMNTKVGP